MQSLPNYMLIRSALRLFAVVLFGCNPPYIPLPAFARTGSSIERGKVVQLLWCSPLRCSDAPPFIPPRRAGGRENGYSLTRTLLTFNFQL